MKRGEFEDAVDRWIHSGELAPSSTKTADEVAAEEFGDALVQAFEASQDEITQYDMGGRM